MWGRLMWRLLRLLFFFVSSVSIGCPGVVPIPAVKGIRLPLYKNLRLFAYSAQGTGGQWSPVSFQEVNYDADNRVRFSDFPDHRTKIFMDVARFSDRYVRGKKPCRSDAFWEIRDKNRFAYLFACESLLEKPRNKNVQYLAKKHVIDTSHYQLRYDPKNPLLFEFLGRRTDQQLLPIAKKSDIKIVADLKGPFDFEFNRDDFQSWIEDFRLGPMGLVGRLNFVLKILMFEIDLNLKPEAHFFLTSVYLPMVLHLPIDTKGSGVFYSWENLPDVRWEWREGMVEMSAPPNLDSERLKKHCRGKSCLFWITGLKGGSSIRFSMVIPLELVEKGFFPKFLDSRSRIPGGGDRLKPGRVGVFFAIDRLRKGEHRWHFWVNPLSTESSQCPKLLKVSTRR